MSDEEVSTERQAEIERVNRWNDRLETVWNEMIVNRAPLSMRVEYVHKFVTSFNALSKARRDLRALDMPKKIVVQETKVDENAPVSIDREVEKLTKSLSLNDKTMPDVLN